MAYRVLYADDDGILRTVVSARFKMMNLEYTVVNDGSEAWKLLDRGEIFDLILSDYEMPEMTGMELLLKVRGDTRTSKMRFALYTSHDGDYNIGDITLKNACKELGATLIQKPCDNFPEIITALLETEVLQ